MVAEMKLNTPRALSTMSGDSLRRRSLEKYACICKTDSLRAQHLYCIDLPRCQVYHFRKDWPRI
jgi:hypothetical protein